MKVPEGSEALSKGCKSRIQEVPRFQVRVPRKGSKPLRVPGSKRFPGSKVKVEEVARFQVRVPSQGSRRGFEVQVRFRKVPKFQLGFCVQVARGSEIPNKGSK